MSDQIKPIGIALDTSGIDAGTAALDKLAATGPKVDSALKTVETAAAKTGKTLASLGAGAGDGFAETTKKVEPFVAKMGDADKAIKATGVSAAQTAAALRQVPAQFTDIATSLAAGQAPLTVFLQQGGQLKDTFGGAGAAARALGGYVLGLVSPFTIAAAAAGAALLAYNQGANEAQAYARALILSGNAAGTTAAQLQGLAAAQSKVVGTQSQAADALAQLAATGRISADQLGLAADAALRLARVGVPLDETIKKFAQLGKDPLKGLIELNEAENFLTESVYKQVKALTEQGRLAEAAKIAIGEYARVGVERSDELRESLGTLELGWLSLKTSAAKAWDAMLNVGREDTAQDKLARLRDEIVAAQAKVEQARSGELTKDRPFLDAGRIAQAQQQRVLALQGEAYALELVLQLEKENADAKREGIVATKGTIKADEDIAKSKSKVSAELEREAAALERAIGLSGSYYKDLAELVKLRQQSKLTEEQYVAAIGKLINAQPIVREQLQAESEARQQAKKLLDEQAKAYERSLEAQLRSVERVDEQIQKLKDENDALLLSASSNISLAAAVEMLTAARLTERRVKADAAGDYLTAAALQAEIDKRKELAGLINAKDAREAARKSGDEAAREWKRTADQINQSLTDALLRGFESGKGFAKNFRDTLVNAFKTMVLRPIISAVLQPISAAASGVINGVVGSVAGSVAGSVGAGVLGGLGIGAVSASSIGSAIGAGFMNTIAGGTIAGGQAAGLLAGGGATGTGVAGMIGGALPWVGGAVLIANALGLFRSTKQVGAGITGTLGGTIEDFVVNRKSGTLFSGPKYSTPTVGVSSFNTDLQNTFNALRDQAGKFAEALGLSGEAARNFTTQIGSDQLSADTGGRGIRLEGLTPEQSSAKIKAALEAANDELARSVLGSFADSLKQQGETASQTLERLAGGLLSVNEVLKQLGQTAYQSSIEGAGLAASLLKQFDGIQQLQQLAGAYFENFYTEAERNALSTKQLSDSIKALGFQVPTTRDAFRALVEAQDLSTESGQKAYAELLKLAPSFAALVPAAQEAGVAVDDLAQQMAEAGRRALASLAEQTGSLQVDLLNAQGSTAEAAALARQQALAKITEGLSAQDAAAATAAYDLNAALKQQIDSTNAATQAAQDAASRQAAIASQRESIQARIDGLLGDTAAVRARELAALDDSNKALQEHYYQLEDQAAAAKTAADALQSVQNALSSLGDTRFNLENQLLTLQGDMASVLARTRDRDLAKLTAGMSEEDAKKIAAAYDYNTALQDQIDATKAAQKQAEESAAAQQRAADDAARAAQQVADAWKSAGNDLLKEAERIRATISGDSSSSFAQAQAKFAITLAQAGSGNLDAVKALPGLSQALLSLGEQQAVSFSDLQSLRNRTAASLERLAASLGIGSISATSSGSSGSPAIAATAYTASNFMAVTQSTQDELLGEIRALNEAVTVLRGQLDVSNANTGRAAKALEGDQSSPILVELAT